ncbi:DUF3048 domain-containing protein [Candidatus Berkelbacteria bacterium]|nr:DUF3048 domain-containing protein [Candidatus Berkelbacteria bacterium]
MEESNLTPRTGWFDRLRTVLVGKQGRAVLGIGLFVLVFGAALWAAYARYAGDGGTSTTNPGGKRFLPSFSLSDSQTTKSAILTGQAVASERATRRPLAVMIENHPDARPQAGLVVADMVFEAIVEGGITRFMAVFGSQEAETIGPIRSSRPFYVAWAAGLHALYAHAGGSQAALALIPTVNEIVDLPHAAAYFQREPKPNVATEHTLFSSTKQLYSYATEKKASTDAQIKSYRFTNDGPLATRPASAKATINFSTQAYQVDWQYEPSTNRYARSLAGQAHVDRTSGDQITASNIAVLTVARSFDPNTNQGKGEWSMQTEGSGKLLLLQNGTVTEGTWKRPTRSDLPLLLDDKGRELELVRGTTWFEIVPPDIAVSHEEQSTKTTPSLKQ